MERAARLADRFLGSIGERPAPEAQTPAVPLTDGVVAMTLAALVATAAVLGATVWFVAAFLGDAGMGAMGALFLLGVGGLLTVVPIAAGLALRARGRPFATRSAWVLFNALFVMIVLNTVFSTVFFGPGLLIILTIEVIVCCLAARAYTFWRASPQSPS